MVIPSKIPGRYGFYSTLEKRKVVKEQNKLDLKNRILLNKGKSK